MNIIEQQLTLMDFIDGDEILKKLEVCGRTCYKSDDLITNDSATKFVKKIIDSKHESVLEHVSITVKAITNRSISHQLVRHRIASYSQESQRYCNYNKDKFNSEITVIKPLYFDEGTEPYKIWKDSCEADEVAYFELLNYGCSPEQAREVLPNSTKTEIIMTMNLRQWRNFLIQRLDIVAHPQMRELVEPLLKLFKKNIPVVFDDISAYRNKVDKKTDVEVILEALEYVSKNKGIMKSLTVHNAKIRLFDKFKDNKIVFNCKTEEDADHLLESLKSKGIEWVEGNSEGSEWYDYKNDTCYDYDDDLGYSDIEYYTDNDYEIVEYKKGMLI